MKNEAMTAARVVLHVVVLSRFSLMAATQLPVYRDEVGHLQSEIDSRSKSIIDRVVFSRFNDDLLLIEGTDDSHHKWTATLPYVGGVGWTSVWTGDFDQNGRSDFLIISSFPENGRCPSYGTVTFLMQDQRGRPVSWIIRTRLDAEPKPSQEVPIAIATGLDSRLFVISTRCGVYDDPKDDALRVSAVYAPEQTSWKPADSKASVAAIREARSRGYLAGVKENSRIASVLRPERTGPREDTRIASITLPRNSFCKPAPYEPGASFDPVNRCAPSFEFEDGTRLYGWPTLVDDCEQGRDILAPSSKSVPVLREMAGHHSLIWRSEEFPGGYVRTLWSRRCSGQ